jgi:hypothetical protein
MKNFILLFSITISILSCGPNKAELEAREKFLIDSSATATADSALKAIAANEDCKELRAQLAMEEDKLNDIKQWQLGRGEAQKDQQLKDQYKLIEDIKEQVKHCPN